MKCSNVQAPGKVAREDSRDQHTLDQTTFGATNIRTASKAKKELNGGFKSLGRSGWAGALFRLEPLSNGYTFVGKGTVQPLVQVLQIKANRYVHTNALQRKAILVYLGNVDFISLFHLMQRSSTGKEAWQCGIELERLQLEILRTYHEVATMDVQQRPSKRSLEFRARTALS